MSEQITKWPDKCPITRRDFFMEIDGVPTYGGPYDSYTIPEMSGEANQPFHERELFVRRYDHDRGGWVEDEFIPLRVIHEDVLMELEEAAQPSPAPSALADIAAERRRQIEEEGWTPEHDDKYGQHTLTSAAGSYAMHTLAYPAGDPPPTWPWAASWWKPSEDPRRNWVKAGALIVAEIERHDRAARAEQKAPPCTTPSPS